jgi:hypothetical protein
MYPTCTYGTCSYSFVTLAIHHKSLRSILSPCDLYLWDPSPSDLWDPTAYVSSVLVGPFSISIRPVGPNGLRVTCAYGPFSIRLVGPNNTFLHLHPTCGSRRLACHLLLPRFNKFKLKKNHETWESNPGPRARNRPSSPLR